MYCLIAVSATGIMGIGALVDSQYDLSFLKDERFESWDCK